MEKFLIVGLGNIGPEYVGTRHNAGFEVVEALIVKYKGMFRSARLADVSEIKVRGKLLIVIKPTTFMNLSGKAVKYWMDKENIPAERVLVILDDLAIPLSRIRLRASGSDGGHNGLKSIQETISTVNYPRLRFGIGATYPKGRQIEFVLGKWDPVEIPVVKKKVDKSVEVIESFAVRGLAAAMNEVNNLEFVN
ncbi:MAG TPA: aminoacyl-tRNA hydrolase [Chitinophagaceae bacterium]|jgi:PTH1 family peptidyl-tRNA hydrolase|nr:aminoacyl-tRNA hydrolase [Chitinophagaceae bacterium]